MPESYVELDGFPVLRVRPDFEGRGPSEAFGRLEAKLGSLQGRKFYGTFRRTASGAEYYACVAQLPEDDPQKLRVETSRIAGGLYARRKLENWHERVAEIPQIFGEMLARESVDGTRPSLEFYRSQKEVELLLPVTARRP
jgi:hypothetical protein